MTDSLSRLLHDVRPRGALFDRSFMHEPWSLRFTEGSPLTLLAMLRGDAWVTPDRGKALQLGTGDVAIVLGPEPFVVSDEPDTPPSVVVRAGGLCTTPDGRALEDAADVVTLAMCGPDPGEGAALLTATFPVQASVCQQILDVLLPALVVPANIVAHPALDMIAAELSTDRAGQQAVLDRLLELLLVSALREWLDRPGSGAPAWYQAQGDPVVGPALRLIHEDPAHSWTVAELAGRAAVSRAAFAHRFTQLVGEPPISYLSCWRLCLAADLLRQTDETVGSIARRVGYANAYALSVAFKRTYGTRPSDHRATA